MSTQTNENNLYGLVMTPLTKSDLAGLFTAAGWKVRSCSWSDYEITSSFAELIVEGENPILVHGAVNDILDNAPRIASILRRANLAFSLECYGAGHTLLREIRE